MRHMSTRAGITSLAIVLALLTTAAGWVSGRPALHHPAVAVGAAPGGLLPPRCDRIPADHNPALRAHRACRP